MQDDYVNVKVGKNNYIFFYLHMCIYIYLFLFYFFTFYDCYSNRETVTQQRCPSDDSRTTFSPPHLPLIALFSLISLINLNLKQVLYCGRYSSITSCIHSKCLFYFCGSHTPPTDRQTLSLSRTPCSVIFCHAINLHPSISFLSPSTLSGFLLLSALIKVHFVTERH